MASIRKNTASQHIGFCLNSTAAGAPVTAGGAGTIVIDNGSQAACGGTFTHKGTGQWDYAPTQAETNGTCISFAFTGTGAIQVGMTFYTDNWDTTAAVLTSGSGAGQITVSGAGAVTLVTTATTVTNQLTAAAIATGVWQDSTAGDFTTASSIGKSLYTGNVVPGGTNGLFIAGTNAATTITTGLTTTFTGNLTGSVGSVTGAVGSVTGAVGSVTGAVGSVTGNVGGNVVGSVASVTAGVTVTTNNDKTGYALTAPYDFAKGTVAMTESYAALHAAPTPAQILFETRALLAENSVALTTVTAKKIDGSTTAATFTIDSSTAPTTITRAS